MGAHKNFLQTHLHTSPCFSLPSAFFFPSLPSFSPLSTLLFPLCRIARPLSIQVDCLQEAVALQRGTGRSPGHKRNLRRWNVFVGNILFFYGNKKCCNWSESSLVHFPGDGKCPLLPMPMSAIGSSSGRHRLLCLVFVRDVLIIIAVIGD